MFYQMMRLKEIVLRTNQKLFGHRFIMDKVVPGGVEADIDKNGKLEVLEELDWLAREFEKLVVIYRENPSLEDRVRDTGILKPKRARELCVVGPVARASGLNLDCRIYNPFPPYDQLDRIELDVPVLITGDVHARTKVRIDEVRESIRIIRMMLAELPEGKLTSPVTLPSAESAGFSAIEGWRGEIIYWLQAGPKGELNRCMVRDPSSVNWLALNRRYPAILSLTFLFATRVLISRIQGMIYDKDIASDIPYRHCNRAASRELLWDKTMVPDLKRLL